MLQCQATMLHPFNGMQQGAKRGEIRVLARKLIDCSGSLGGVGGIEGVAWGDAELPVETSGKV
jgi:hypothetical protein